MDKDIQKDETTNKSQSKEGTQPQNNPLLTVVKPTIVKVFNTDSADRLKGDSKNG